MTSQLARRLFETNDSDDESPLPQPVPIKPRRAPFVAIFHALDTDDRILVQIPNASPIVYEAHALERQGDLDLSLSRHWDVYRYSDYQFIGSFWVHPKLSIWPTEGAPTAHTPFYWYRPLEPVELDEDTLEPVLNFVAGHNGVDTTREAVWTVYQEGAPHSFSIDYDPTPDMVSRGDD